jgi:hypothetical protein
MRFLTSLVFGITACGGGWSAADTSAATNAARAETALEVLCGADAGPCLPSQVRALERASYCANASMLSRHGQAVPDAGIACAP